MNAYYERTNRTAVATGDRTINVNVGDKLIAAICAIVAFFTTTVAIRIEKSVVCTAGFVAFFGVIGSIESGSLSMLLGVAICAAISIAEFFILKSMFKKKNVEKTSSVSANN